MKFSIIVPCYNLEPWIRTCLDSVAAQSFADWECIVVDDESQDGSPAICDAYAAKDARFKIIHQKNAGEGGARNAGLAVAKGEWVFFLDGDDVMAPGALKRLAGIVEKHPNEKLVRFEFENFDDGAALPVIDATRASRPRVVDISRQIEYDDYFVYVWQFIFRREMIADMHFDRYKRGADRTFIVPVLCFKACSFVATEGACYFYRKRQGSAMNSVPNEQVVRDELRHRIDMVRLLRKSGKKVEYGNQYWVRNFFAYDFFDWMKGRKREERWRLIKEWLSCVSVLLNDQQVVWYQRIAYKLSTKCQSHLPALLLRNIWILKRYLRATLQCRRGKCKAFVQTLGA